MIICGWLGSAFTGFAIASAAIFPVSAQALLANGEALFRQRCQVCHSVVAAKPAGVGPNLRGVVGRKAGAALFKYSAAMQQSKLNWTEANLDRYLAAPTKVMPGTKMVIAVADRAQRTEIVKYLSQAK